MNGKLIVIEGLDGSGKATQAALLAERLCAQGQPARRLSFPCYDDESSALVRMYLAGEFGSRPQDVNCYAASAFYAVDRYASYKKDWGREYENGGVFIADRYTTSNAVFQLAKLSKEKRDDYLDWLFDLEYNKLGIPEPDLVIYLCMSPEVCEKLLEKRYDSDENKKDIHEKDAAFQQLARESADYCAERLGWGTVLCDDGRDPFPATVIAKQIYDLCGEIL